MRAIEVISSEEVLNDAVNNLGIEGFWFFFIFRFMHQLVDKFFANLKANLIKHSLVPHFVCHILNDLTIS